MSKEAKAKIVELVTDAVLKECYTSDCAEPWPSPDESTQVELGGTVFNICTGDDRELGRVMYASVDSELTYEQVQASLEKVGMETVFEFSEDDFGEGAHSDEVMCGFSSNDVITTAATAKI